MTPIRKKLGAWAAVVPIVVALFVGEMVHWQYLASLAGLAILSVILYLIWAGTYWTLLKAHAFWRMTRSSPAAQAPGEAPDRIEAAARRLRPILRPLIDAMRDRRARLANTSASKAASAPQASASDTPRQDSDAAPRLVRVTTPHDFSEIEDVDRRYSPGVSAPSPALQGVSQAHADIVYAIEEFREVLRKGNKYYYRVCSIYVDQVLGHRMEMAEKALKDIIIPRAPKYLYDRIMHAGGGSKFAGGMDLRRAGLVIAEEERKPDAIFIGETDPATVYPTAPIVHQGEGHLVTIASTGAGKGQRFILPALMTYEGPVVCLDPKGENYRTTKGHRDLMGGVFKWAPFDRNGDTDSFNPLDAIEDWDDARVVADLLIAPSDSGEKRFWDQSARDFVRGLIMYVKTLEPERRTMREVVRILYASEEEHEDLRERLAESDDEMLVELANQFGVMADNMFRSILQSARAELDGWRSKQIADATSTTSENWDISYFVVSLRIQELLATTDETIGHIGYRARQYSDGTGSMVRGGAYSVFFIIPPDRMRSYASVLRVLLGVHLNAWSRAESAQEEEMAEYDVPYQVPALFVFDELAQLGHMPIVEDQIAIARSAKIRMWLIAQDLPQLKRTYPRWESMLGNCRTQIFFGVNDLETATYVSNRAGDKTTVYEETRPLVTPTELMGPTFANKSVIFARGAPPIQAHLPPPFHQEEAMRSIERFLKMWDATLPRRERPEERPVAPEEADEDEAVDEMEVVEDLADGEDEGRGSSLAESADSSSATAIDEDASTDEAPTSVSDQVDEQPAAEAMPLPTGEEAEALDDKAGNAGKETETGARGAPKKRPKKPSGRKPATDAETPPPRRKPRPRQRPESSASKDE